MERSKLVTIRKRFLKLKKCWVKRMLSKQEQENEQKEIQNSTNWLTWVFLLFYSEKFPWGWRRSNTNNTLKNHSVNCLAHKLEKTVQKYSTSPKSPRPALVRRWSTLKTSKMLNLSSARESWNDWPSKFWASLHNCYSIFDRLGTSEHLLVQQKLSGWSNDWRARQEKRRQTLQHCLIFTLSKS